MLRLNKFIVNLNNLGLHLIISRHKSAVLFQLVGRDKYD